MTGLATLLAEMPVSEERWETNVTTILFDSRKEKSCQTRRPIALFVVVLSIEFMSVMPVAGLRWPLVEWNEVDDLFALGCLLLAYVEGVSVARTFAQKHGYEINADQ